MPRISGRMAVLLGCLYICLTAGPLLGQDRATCLHFFGQTSTPERFECISALFSQAPIHATLGNIAPSNGFPIGLVLEREYNDTNKQTGASQSVSPSLTFVGSTNGSWGVHGEVDWFPPAVVSEKKSPHCYQFLHHCTTDPPLFILSGNYESIQTLDFYGIGPVSPSTQFQYGENQLVAGVHADIPLTNYLHFIGSTEGLKTQLKEETSASSVNLNFTEGTAPGLALQPAYVHSTAGLRFKTVYVHEAQDGSVAIKPRLTVSWNGKALYNWYSDVGHGAYSFQQFTFNSTGGDALVFQFGGINKKPGDSFANKFFCGQKKEDRCDFGKLSLGTMLVLSRTTGANMVPFYNQPTLGGSDINSLQSLRGYDNYRFRGPDAALVQVDYALTLRKPKTDWTLVGPYIFYDAGIVGVEAADLSIEHWRQDAGTGLFLKFVGNIVAEAYVAGGAGHGAHFGYSLNRFF
ncbi:MAG: hypothetical protein ABSB39_07580 [Candidatus Sulfotelmatobacter sp.]|jgi:hypothetical protein